jgi:carboxyl-terminal processing protease
MKKQMLMVAVALAVSAHIVTAQPGGTAPVVAGAAALPAQIKPTTAETQAALWGSRVLSRYHYKAMPLDDAMSAKIFDNYFKSLDSEKLYFTQVDLDAFGFARTRLDDAINNEDLTLPFQIYATYQQRFNERMVYARDLVKNGKLEFNTDESLQIDREKAAWAKNEDEARDLWRRRVKNDWLRLKLAGKDDKGIRETLDKRYEGYQNRLKKLNHEDVFQMFMNAYATAIDPHTNYLGPRSAENFDIAMRLSLDGIGAVLQSRDDYTVVREVVPGGPADKSGKLKVGDRIVGVAQGNAAFTDVTGWRIDDVVQLVRGERNSTVRLDILPGDAGQDAKHNTISLVRQKISMEEQSAKKEIVTVKDGGVTRRIGVIKLPGFYQDFEARRRGDKDFKSATRDVARILGELKKEKVDNVLIDLRNNGGGSLVEAVELTGLFIDKGPVVQQRNAEGRVEVENDTDAGLAWDGPMGVLINRGSASASEIFAAAIQDYGRGVVIGEPSFGKGTVQTLIGLDRYVPTDKPGDKPKYGELKMTIAQFFRINGGTTQMRGVVPDIKLPTTMDPDMFGESSYDNALPWVQIRPANYLPSGDLKELMAPLQKRHEARIAKDKDFADIQQDIAESMKLRKGNVISLNEAVRRKEREEQEAKTKAREARLAASQNSADDGATAGGKEPPRSKVPTPTKPNKLGKTVVGLKGAITADDGLQGDERSLTAELAAEKAAKAAKDVYLQEAAHILADEAGMIKSDTRMASRTMPYLSFVKPKGN